MTSWLTILLMTLGVLLGVAAAGDLLRRRRERGEWVFALMCAEAGLTRADRRTLRELACKAGLPNPGCLLLSRGCFDRAASAAAASGMDRDRIESLRRRINDPAEREVGEPMARRLSKA